MDRVFTIEQLRPIKNGMTISRDAKWELQLALHSFLSEKTLPSARNAMNNIIKSGEIMKLKDLISYEEGSIRFLRSYYRLPVKCHCIKLGYFG